MSSIVVILIFCKYSNNIAYISLSSVTFFCFFSLIACSFTEKEKKPRKFRFAWLLFLFKMQSLHYRYLVYLFIGVLVKCPVYLIIG